MYALVDTCLTSKIYGYCYCMASLLHTDNKLIWLLKHLTVTHNNNWMINALCMLMEDLVAVYVGCAEKFTDTSSIIIYYHTVIFWCRKTLVKMQITGGSPNCTYHLKLNMSCEINKESEQAEYTKDLLPKSFWWEICQSFPLSTICTIL